MGALLKKCDVPHIMKSNRFSFGLRSLSVFAFIAVAATLTGASYFLSFNNDIRQLSQTGTIRLAQASDRLLGQLESYRELPNYLAQHPDVIAALRSGTTDDTHELLASAALTSGADDVYLLDPDGTVIASSDYEEPVSFLARNFASRPDVVAAMSGTMPSIGPKVATKNADSAAMVMSQVSARPKPPPTALTAKWKTARTTSAIRLTP